MSLFFFLGLLSVGWTAYELGRMSRASGRVEAWDEKGRPLRVDLMS